MSIIKHIIVHAVGMLRCIRKSHQNISAESLQYRLENNSGKRICYLIGTSTNGNMGDQAISYSQIRFLSEECDCDVIEINIDSYWLVRFWLVKNIKPLDFIAIQGGGNIGNEYYGAVYVRRDIALKFPKNKVINFPQTVYFSNDKEGRFERRLSAYIYGKHKDFHLVAREKYSYDEMCRLYSKNDIRLTPDIVLYYSDYDIEEVSPSGALLCLRSDCEGILSSDDKKIIEKIARETFSSVGYTDTFEHDISKIDLNNRKGMVESKLNEFAKAELIITDRLHGMVFATLAGVPCIVFRNYNKKVEGVYDWIKDCTNVVLIDSIDQLNPAIYDMLSKPRIKYDCKALRGKFEPLDEIFTK